MAGSSRLRLEGADDASVTYRGTIESAARLGAIDSDMTSVSG